MRRQKRHIIYLIASILSLLAVILTLVFIPPKPSFQLGPIAIPPVIVLFVPLVIFFFSVPTFLLKSRKHGILLSLFILIYLIFRLVGLTHPIFLIILIGIFLSFELFFSNRQPRSLRE